MKQIVNKTQRPIRVPLPGGKHLFLGPAKAGQVSDQAVNAPSFQKLVAAGIPNNPPRWPEATAIVKKILYTYKEDAKDWERINDWIDRIGWPRFFELTELPFTKFHIDNWRGSRKSLNASSHLRF